MRRFLALICAGVLTLALAPVALAAPPTNDEQAGATAVTVTADVPFTDVLDTTAATANSTDPVWMQTSDEWVGERPTPIGPTVWYVYTAAESGTLFVDLTASDYSPIMLVLQSDLTVVNVAFGSTTLEVLAGQTYYFVIGDTDDSNGLGGMLRVSVSVQAPDPIPVEAQIGVTGATIVDGVLVVTGTLSATGDYSSTILSVEAAQKGKAPATGVNYIYDAGSEWAVSVPAPATPWRAARTSVTVQVVFLDSEGLAVDSRTYDTAVRAEQVEPVPVPELGSVSGRFTLTDDETGEAVGVVVDVGLAPGVYGPVATGALSIGSGPFAGTYEPYSLVFWIDGGTFAGLSIQLPSSSLTIYLGTMVDGAQRVSIIQWSEDGSTVVGSMIGTVTKKGFTIVMPAE